MRRFVIMATNLRVRTVEPIGLNCFVPLRSFWPRILQFLIGGHLTRASRRDLREQGAGRITNFLMQGQIRIQRFVAGGIGTKVVDVSINARIRSGLNEMHVVQSFIRDKSLENRSTM